MTQAISDDVDDEAERLFWCFAAMLDPSQTGNAPLSQRDAFKRAIRPSLCAATKEVNDSLRAQLAERTRELAEARAYLYTKDQAFSVKAGDERLKSAEFVSIETPQK